MVFFRVFNMHNKKILSVYVYVYNSHYSETATGERNGSKNLVFCVHVSTFLVDSPFTIKYFRRKSECAQIFSAYSSNKQKEIKVRKKKILTFINLIMPDDFNGTIF